jgi:glycosyltransferase involved in cell wall biosynthesis
MNDTVDSPPSGAALRVAWVAGRDTLRNFGRTLNPLAVGLMDELIELTLLVPHEIDTSEIPSPPVEIVRYGRAKWPNRRRSAGSVLGALRSRNIELLHALDSSVVKFTRDLARGRGIDYVVSSYALSDAWRFGRLGSPCVGVLAGCEGIESKLMRHHVTAAANIRLVRPGVHQVKHPTCFRDPERSIAIVASGRVRSRRGAGALLESFAELKRRQYECVFVVIGSGAMEPAMRKRAASLGLQHEVTFAEHQSSSQLWDIMKAADIYISPDPPRTMDFGVLLAMAGGVPVLTGASREDFILDDRTALRYKPASSKDLTAKLVSLLEDRAAARSLAEGALEYLRKQHSPTGMVSAIREIYHQGVS